MPNKIIATNIDGTGKEHKDSSKIQGGECIFPFIHKGEMYKECAKSKKGKWCATEVDSKKRMTKLGFCPQTPKKLTVKKSSPKSLKKKSVKKEEKKSQNNLNQIPVNVPVGMEKYVRPKNDMLKISHWENPNRKNFLNWFDNAFKKYRVKRGEKIEVDMDNNLDEKGSIMPLKRDLFTTQKIVRDYMSKDSPYRGILLYHGLGVGKSCASIAVTEANKSDRKIVVLLMKSIKQNYINELMTCGDEYFKLNQHWEFFPCSPTKNTEKYLFALNQGITKSSILINNGAYLVNFRRKPNYENLKGIEKEKLKIQILKMIDSKYDFKHTNGLTATQLDRMEENRYFDNKLVIIDEVHNIINGMASGGSMRAERLNQLFMNAQNVRFVFLSGTPMKNIPFEVAKIFNVLRGYITNHIFTLGLGRGRTKMEWEELENELYEHPLVDQVIVDSRSKEVKINRNPYGFINHEKGLIKSDLNEVTDQQFLEDITEYIKEMLNYKVLKTEKEVTTTFPDDNKEFMEMFYDVDNNDIKDQELFKRRTLGMTSYVASARQDLVPEIRTKEILEIPMSGYMFNKYAMVRKSEIEKDKNSKNQQKKASSKKGGENIFTVNSSYRAYSRMLCQFVFPEKIERPFKGDLKDIEFDDDSETARLISEVTVEYETKILKAKKTVDKEKLKRELMLKKKEIQGKSKEYERRLGEALKQLDRQREEYLVYDNGNPEKLMKYSPKYAEIIGRLLRDRGSKEKGLKFIYTEYKTCEGVGIFSIALKANGYSPFKIKKDEEGEWELDFDPEIDKSPKFAVWTGDEESDLILSIYNDQLGKLPEKLRGQVEKINKTNKRGQILEILMTTKQGAEGLNTRHVRQLHVVEPYWNPVRLDQVIGRAVRTNSHMELPKKDRNVDIYIYLSKATKGQLRSDVTISNDFDGKTSDQVLFNIAERKRKIMNIILGIIKEAAVDCSINLKENQVTEKDLKCINFGTITSRKKFSHTANIKDEIKEKERATRVKTKKIKPIPIKFKDGRRYFMIDKHIYDWDAVLTGRKGQPVGDVIMKNGKQIAKPYKK